MTHNEKAALRWAVREARSNRGLHTGNPDPRRLQEFDRNLEYCADALKALAKEPGTP